MKTPRRFMLTRRLFIAMLSVDGSTRVEEADTLVPGLPVRLGFPQMLRHCIETKPRESQRRERLGGRPCIVTGLCDNLVGKIGKATRTNDVLNQ